jgi:hypothetical protein
MAPDDAHQDGWWKSVNKIKECCVYYIIFIMIFDDLRDKINFLNTLVPIAYWIGQINTDNITLNFNFIMFALGIVFAAIQLYYSDFIERLYKKYFGRRDISIEEFPAIVPSLKKSPNIVYLGAIIVIYGFTTFIFMCIGVKNGTIWALIAVYLIGLLYIIFLVAHFLRNNLTEVIAVGRNWTRK